MKSQGAKKTQPKKKTRQAKQKSSAFSLEIGSPAKGSPAKGSPAKGSSAEGTHGKGSSVTSGLQVYRCTYFSNVLK